MIDAAAVELLARAKDGEGVKSGPWGLAIILLLCVAVYFLFKSMSKHLKRVREDFPSDEPEPAEDPKPENTAGTDQPTEVPPGEAPKPPPA